MSNTQTHSHTEKTNCTMTARRGVSHPPCCTQMSTITQCDKLVTDDRYQFITLTVRT